MIGQIDMKLTAYVNTIYDSSLKVKQMHIVIKICVILANNLDCIFALNN